MTYMIFFHHNNHLGTVCDSKNYLFKDLISECGTPYETHFDTAETLQSSQFRLPAQKLVLEPIGSVVAWGIEGKKTGSFPKLEVVTVIDKPSV